MNLSSWIERGDGDTLTMGTGLVLDCFYVPPTDSTHESIHNKHIGAISGVSCASTETFVEQVWVLGCQLRTFPGFV